MTEAAGYIMQIANDLAGLLEDIRTGQLVLNVQALAPPATHQSKEAEIEAKAWELLLSNSFDVMGDTLGTLDMKAQIDMEAAKPHFEMARAVARAWVESRQAKGEGEA